MCCRAQACLRRAVNLFERGVGCKKRKNAQKIETLKHIGARRGHAPALQKIPNGASRTPPPAAVFRQCLSRVNFCTKIAPVVKRTEREKVGFVSERVASDYVNQK